MCSLKKPFTRTGEVSIDFMNRIWSHFAGALECVPSGCRVSSFNTLGNGSSLPVLRCTVRFMVVYRRPRDSLRGLNVVLPCNLGKSDFHIAGHLLAIPFYYNIVHPSYVYVKALDVSWNCVQKSLLCPCLETGLDVFHAQQCSCHFLESLRDESSIL